MVSSKKKRGKPRKAAKRLSAAICTSDRNDAVERMTSLIESSDEARHQVAKQFLSLFQMANNSITLSFLSNNSNLLIQKLFALVYFQRCLDFCKDAKMRSLMKLWLM